MIGLIFFSPHEFINFGDLRCSEWVLRVYTSSYFNSFFFYSFFLSWKFFHIHSPVIWMTTACNQPISIGWRQHTKYFIWIFIWQFIYPLCVQVSVSCTCEVSNVELAGWLGGLSFSGYVAHFVTCLVTEACLTADPGVASSIPARSQTNQNHLFLPNLIIAALASIQNEWWV